MRNQAVGQFGERLAADFLRRRGYAIMEQNLKTSFKELDLVATKGDLLVFVEVKTRTSSYLGEAVDMVTAKKLKNLKQAAMIYLRQQKRFFSNFRFDLVAVDIDKLDNSAKIKHYIDII